MRFAVLVKANKDTEAGVLPSREMLANMGAFNEELVKDGWLLEADGFQDSSKGARIRFEPGGKTTVTNGPFPETQHLVAGYWIVKANSREEVVERFKHAPFDAGQELEIRQVFEAEDFGDNLPRAN